MHLIMDIENMREKNKQNNKAILKNIVLGMRQGPYYEIKQGLKGGDLVVIMGQQRLFEGADVKLEE